MWNIPSSSLNFKIRDFTVELVVSHSVFTIVLLRTASIIADRTAALSLIYSDKDYIRHDKASSSMLLFIFIICLFKQDFNYPKAPLVEEADKYFLNPRIGLLTFSPSMFVLFF